MTESRSQIIKEQFDAIHRDLDDQMVLLKEQGKRLSEAFKVIKRSKER